MLVMTAMRNTIGTTLAVGLAGLMVGCSGPRLGHYDVVVTPDSSLREGSTLPPVKVDVVGVKPADVSRWQSYSVDQYFSGSDSLRHDFAPFARQLSFDANSDKPQTITKNDPIWDEWAKAGVMKVFVLANARTMQPGGGVDARKIEVPMTTDRFDDRTKIDIFIRKSGVDVATPMKPVKE